MIPEIGNFALIIALSLAILLAVFPLWGSLNNNYNWMRMARPLAVGMFVFMAISFGCLVASFLNNDFSVIYVATNGNSKLPLMYKISAVWGAHEGSLLLWAFLLSGWTLAIAMFSRSLPLQMVSRVLSVMAIVAVGFLLFMLVTSNPFDRIFPAPLEGRDLNPLLQDPGLAIHPPMLYMGYVGFAVAFGFAIAALIGGKLDAAWARWSRPWTTIAWVFLTGGIALGSWWAYDELGWGGWWFWDPVENASFMPWLVGTALMHSLAVTEKRGAFKSWTVLLAIATFSLSLLGTFLVRSGVLNSVHAFASDPARGVFILIFLCVVVGGSLALYAWRAPSVSSGGTFGLLSRETFLLVNNLLLSVVAAMVLFGTLAPLIYEAMGWGKISVGFPWFNQMFVILTPLLAVAIGIGPLSRWKHNDPKWLFAQLKHALIVTSIVAVASLLPWVNHGHLLVSLGIVLAAWIVSTQVESLRQRVRNRRGIGAIWQDLRNGSRSYYGMWLAHVGVAAFIIGITGVTNFEIERDVRMAPGAKAEMAGYEFVFEGVVKTMGPNYEADRGRVSIYEDGKKIGVLEPEKRIYFSQAKPMTEAAIDITWSRDLYVSLGEPLGNGEWAMRLYYKPFVRWIWSAAILMALGGLLSISDRRYRLLWRKAIAKTPAATVGAKA